MSRSRTWCGELFSAIVVGALYWARSCGWDWLSRTLSMRKIQIGRRFKQCWPRVPGTSHRPRQWLPKLTAQRKIQARPYNLSGTGSRRGLTIPTAPARSLRYRRMVGGTKRVGPKGNVWSLPMSRRGCKSRGVTTLRVVGGSHSTNKRGVSGRAVAGAGVRPSGSTVLRLEWWNIETWWMSTWWECRSAQQGY